MIIKKSQQALMEGSEGFTMIELLLSMTIFAIAVMAIASMQFAALKANESAGGVSEAATIAQNQIEQLMSIEYIPSSVDADLTTGVHQGPIQDRYNVTWTVAPYVGIPGANAISIQVTVRWRSRGVSSAVNLNTLKTEEI